MTTKPLDERPPPYMSQGSQASTIVDRPDPPISAILELDHSTRASRLNYATSRGRFSILEYYELTFPLLFSHHGVEKVMAVAVDEELDTLLEVVF